MLPSTSNRVPEHTADHINERILRQTRMNVSHVATEGSEAIDRRLIELDYEWDIERTLEANAATFSLIGLALGATVNRKWFMLSGAVAAFLLQHALQGWCPPLPVFRRMGIRTSREIDYERYALKALRGDFDDIPSPGRAGDGARTRKLFEAVES